MKQFLWPATVFAIVVVTMPWVRGGGSGHTIFNDDVLITSNLGVGVDNPNEQNFSFDILRLQEDVIRIHFDDTSEGLLPANDWRFLINDELSTGEEYFAIEDSTAATVPFRLDAGAPKLSFQITEEGIDLGVENLSLDNELGIGTDAPEQTLHIRTESNPTIRFQSTANAGHQWDVVGTDAEFFLQDISHGSNIPFRVGIGAPKNSLLVTPITGDVGIGLDNPTAPLHIRRTGGSAKVLVEETSATVASRELLELSNPGGNQIRFNNTDSGVNWLLQQDTNHVFSIGPEGDDILVVTPDQQVGIGIDVPEETLHVRSTNGTAKMLVEEAATATASRNLLRLKNPGGALLTMNNTASSNMWHVGNRNTDELVVSLDSSTGDELIIRTNGQVEIGPGASSVFVLDSSGNLTIQGSLSQGSDRTRKEIKETANRAETLAKVLELPISRWSFRDDPTDTQHIGPMAQDFHATFDVGHSDTTIAPLDTAGVALAAIQGLREVIVDKNQRIGSLKQEIVQLQELLSEVRNRLDTKAD